jgi:hypothetical protein
MNAHLKHEKMNVLYQLLREYMDVCAKAYLNLKGIPAKLATSIPPTHPIYWMNHGYATTNKQDIDKLLAIGLSNP